MATDTVESKGIKLTEQEIVMLNELDRKKTAVTNEINFLAQQQIQIDVRKENAIATYKQNLELEKQIASALTDKYGNGSIDTKIGMFIPS